MVCGYIFSPASRFLENIRNGYSEIVEHRRHRSEDGFERPDGARSEYPQTAVVAADVETVGHLHRFTVEMRRAAAFALYHDIVGAECMDKHIALDHAGHHVDPDEGCRQGVARMDDGDIEKTVVDRGARGDVGVVAILRGIAYRHEEGALSQLLAVGTDGVVFRFIAGVCLECALDIGQLAACLLTGRRPR